MHPFHDHLASQLRTELQHGVVVLFDPTAAFQPFVDELGPGTADPAADQDVARVDVAAGGGLTFLAVGVEAQPHGLHQRPHTPLARQQRVRRAAQGRPYLADTPRRMRVDDGADG